MVNLLWRKLMIKRVLIIGGYGNFGSYIAKSLSENPNIQLLIGGRNLAKAEAMVISLGAKNAAEAVELNIFSDLTAKLKRVDANIVIHTSGPFQQQDSFVAKAALEAGAHYIDLADGREFVSNISALDSMAKLKKLSVISGASSVPGLSSAIIDAYQHEFETLETVEYGISTAQKTNRGQATTSAILSYVGMPFKTLVSGSFKNVFGWQSMHREVFLGLGKRLVGNCDVPDLALFPKRYPTLKTIRFYAGLEIPFLHVGLWSISWLRRLRLLPDLSKFAAYLLKISFWFDRLGSDESGFFMRLEGKTRDNANRLVRFDLVARSGDGPFIPCMPAIIIAKKLAAGVEMQNGAHPCMGLLSLDEYLDALKDLKIEWQVSK